MSIKFTTSLDVLSEYTFLEKGKNHTENPQLLCVVTKEENGAKTQYLEVIDRRTIEVNCWTRFLGSLGLGDLANKKVGLKAVAEHINLALIEQQEQPGVHLKDPFILAEKVQGILDRINQDDDVGFGLLRFVNEMNHLKNRAAKEAEKSKVENIDPGSNSATTAAQSGSVATEKKNSEVSSATTASATTQSQKVPKKTATTAIVETKTGLEPSQAQQKPPKIASYPGKYIDDMNFEQKTILANYLDTMPQHKTTEKHPEPWTYLLTDYIDKEGKTLFKAGWHPQESISKALGYPNVENTIASIIKNYPYTRFVQSFPNCHDTFKYSEPVIRIIDPFTPSNGIRNFDNTETYFQYVKCALYLHWKLHTGRMTKEEFERDYNTLNGLVEQGRFEGNPDGAASQVGRLWHMESEFINQVWDNGSIADNPLSVVTMSAGIALKAQADPLFREMLKATRKHEVAQIKGGTWGIFDTASEKARNYLGHCLKRVRKALHEGTTLQPPTFETLQSYIQYNGKPPVKPQLILATQGAKTTPMNGIVQLNDEEIKAALKPTTTEFSYNQSEMEAYETLSQAITTIDTTAIDPAKHANLLHYRGLNAEQRQTCRRYIHNKMRAVVQGKNFEETKLGHLKGYSGESLSFAFKDGEAIFKGEYWTLIIQQDGNSIFYRGSFAGEEARPKTVIHNEQKIFVTDDKEGRGGSSSLNMAQACTGLVMHKLDLIEKILGSEGPNAGLIFDMTQQMLQQLAQKNASQDTVRIKEVVEESDEDSMASEDNWNGAYADPNRGIRNHVISKAIPEGPKVLSATTSTSPIWNPVTQSADAKFTFFFTHSVDGKVALSSQKEVQAGARGGQGETGNRTLRFEYDPEKPNEIMAIFETVNGSEWHLQGVKTSYLVKKDSAGNVECKPQGQQNLDADLFSETGKTQFNTEAPKKMQTALQIAEDQEEIMAAFLNVNDILQSPYSVMCVKPEENTLPTKYVALNGEEVPRAIVLKWQEYHQGTRGVPLIEYGHSSESDAVSQWVGNHHVMPSSKIRDLAKNRIEAPCEYTMMSQEEIPFLISGAPIQMLTGGETGS